LQATSVGQLSHKPETLGDENTRLSPKYDFSTARNIEKLVTLPF
jgi:hypothetical protein